MIEIKGRYNTAICFTPAVETTAAEQINAVCDREAFSASKIRIMPDVHAGTGCTIGTTMTIVDKIVPGMVGVDIGCGMETVRIAERELDFAALDALIREQIPAGQEIRSVPHELSAQVELSSLRCAPRVNLDRARRSIGTLGGGNHFIEVDRGENGDLYLVVHSGSRYLGKQVCEYYQAEAALALCGGARCQIKQLIEEMKREGRSQEIQTELSKRKKLLEEATFPKELAYVEGQLFEDYIHDMRIVQKFAVLNRKVMNDVILNGLGLTPVESFTTIHNYIDTEAMILRKGSVSARAGEKLLIPINMRDGSLICIGKGNEDWNCSAPHGAGRLMSRKAALDTLTMEEYTAEMKDVYSTCVTTATLDESPMAYKPLEEIVEQIGPTAEILERIRPVYNFKAG